MSDRQIDYKRLQVVHAIDGMYTRPTLYASMGLPHPSAEEARELVGYIVDKTLDTILREAAKGLREELIEFVFKSAHDTEPRSHASDLARIEQLNKDALEIVIPKDLLEKNVKARFRYFDVRWGSIRCIDKDGDENTLGTGNR